jgi:hypothetical protein
MGDSRGAVLHALLDPSGGLFGNDRTVVVAIHRWPSAASQSGEFAEVSIGSANVVISCRAVPGRYHPVHLDVTDASCCGAAVGLSAPVGRLSRV